MIPRVPSIQRDGVQTGCGMERLKARPALLGREAARPRWVGCKAHHVPHGVCQRGAATRQGPRPEGPICPEAPAHTRVKRHRRDLAALRNGRLQALAQAAAGEEVASGRRILTVRHEQGRTTWAERLETAVVGIAGLTTCDQYGTVDHRHHHNRRDFQPTPINAVVVRKWNGRNITPGGKTVFLTNAAVTKPLQPFDEDDRSLTENCCIKEAMQQWNLGHPLQKTARAVRVHVVFTLLIFALATAYWWPYEQATTGDEAVGWRRWRRQLLQQTREKAIVFAQHCDGIFHVVEYSLFLGVKLKKLPPGIGTYQENPCQIWARRT